jgi:hypothetical protein
MEENKIETPLSEIDSNVTTEETVVVNETESNDPSSELDGEDVVEAFENDPDVHKLKANEEELMNFDFGMPLNPDVLRAYRAARRVGERRQVSKKENKKKKAKRRMAKKSKR